MPARPACLTADLLHAPPQVPDTQRAAAAALRNLCRDEQWRSILVRAGALDPLVKSARASLAGLFPAENAAAGAAGSGGAAGAGGGSGGGGGLGGGGGGGGVGVGGGDLRQLEYAVGALTNLSYTPECHDHLLVSQVPLSLME